MAFDEEKFMFKPVPFPDVDLRSSTVGGRYETRARYSRLQNSSTPVGPR
jgi:hypothetical protein